MKFFDADILAATAEARSWRHDIHRHPETAFEEERTSAFVAEKLKSFGLEVHTGLAKTGVVGVLRRGERMIALRADMDALPLHEENTFTHRSQITGKMHACGHDGHTAMLLGAAKVLASRADLNVSVAFIFQPAEETEGGGRVMVEEGLFSLFKAEAVFGLHNWPGLPVGKFAVKPGPMMACSDNFEITLKGRGAHAAMPHLGTDTNLCAAQLITALQSIVSRKINPAESAVVSVTNMRSGSDAWNILPEMVYLKGTARAFQESVRDTLEQEITRIASHTAQAFNIEAETRYLRRYPPTVNSTEPAQYAAKIATELVGSASVLTDFLPSMGAEDFAFMLQAVPGAYAWLGNGEGAGGCTLHNPRYDFNDDIIPYGIAYWDRLARGFFIS